MGETNLAQGGDSAPGGFTRLLLPQDAFATICQQHSSLTHHPTCSNRTQSLNGWFSAFSSLPGIWYIVNKYLLKLNRSPGLESTTEIPLHTCPVGVVSLCIHENAEL